MRPALTNHKWVDAYTCLSPFATRYVVGYWRRCNKRQLWFGHQRNNIINSEKSGEKRRKWLFVKVKRYLSISLVPPWQLIVGGRSSRRWLVTQNAPRGGALSPRRNQRISVWGQFLGENPSLKSSTWGYIPTGRGSGLKIRSVWVRIPLPLP